jgi:DnaJ homolog subfamily C member 9
MDSLPDLSRLTLDTGAPKKRGRTTKPAVPPYYGILQLEKGATQDEIRRNFLLLSRKVHPDKNPGDKQAASRFVQLKEAYDTLSDPARRGLYDRGMTPPDSDPEAFAKAYEFFRGVPLNTDDIDAYLDGYRGSVVEEQDLIAFFEENDGDLAMLLSYIIGSRDEDVPRYLAFFQRAIADGRLNRKYANRTKYPFTVTPEDSLQGAPLFEGVPDDDEDEDEDEDGDADEEPDLPTERPDNIPPHMWQMLQAGQEARRERKQRARLALTDKRKR